MSVSLNDTMVKRSRGGSISGRLRACSDLEEIGAISKTEKSLIKDLIISNDSSLRIAMDKYEKGDTSDLQSLLQRARADTIGSALDVTDGLDLDFLAAMNNDPDDDQFGDYLEQEQTDHDPLSDSLHEAKALLPTNNNQNYTFEPYSGYNRFRKLSFDTLFGNPLEADRRRSDSVSSIGLNYDLPSKTTGMYSTASSGTDSEQDFPFMFGDESPYLQHAISLIDKNKTTINKQRPKSSRTIQTSKPPIISTILPMSQSQSNIRNKLPLDKKANASIPINHNDIHKRIPPEIHFKLDHSNKFDPTAHMRMAHLNETQRKEDIAKLLTSTHILQIPKYSMDDGPSLSKFIGGYSAESRKERIQRFIDKRDRRVWTKKVKYDVRKNFADSRVRVKGRFVKKEAEDVLRQLLVEDK